MADFPAPHSGMLLTHFIVSSDVKASRDFYVDVLGGEVVLEGEPTIVQLANAWVTINLGGVPTEDKPDVTLEAPSDTTRTSSFLNIRVADIEGTHRAWSARGANFITDPVDRGAEIRCYLRDPDGHLIEVGQSTSAPTVPSTAELAIAASAASHAADAMVAVDSAGHITFWNVRAEQLFGRRSADVLGETLALIVPEIHRPRHVRGFHEAVSTRRLAHDGRPALVEGVTADGDVVPLEMTLALLPDGTGVVAVLRRGATTPDDFIAASRSDIS